MTKSQILSSPLIEPIRQRYLAQDVDFDSALDVALGKVGLNKSETKVLEYIVSYLTAYLETRPAKTRAGKLLRFLLHVVTFKWGKI